MLRASSLARACTRQEGTRPKTLKISPGASADGSMFYSISGKTPNGMVNISVPVSRGEGKVCAGPLPLGDASPMLQAITRQKGPA